jgi:hypothetical protein
MKQLHKKYVDLKEQLDIKISSKFTSFGTLDRFGTKEIDSSNFAIHQFDKTISELFYELDKCKEKRIT